MPEPLPPDVAIVVPTYNEAGNVTRMVDSLKAALGPRRWEIIFVDDDSPDGTAEKVAQCAREDSRIRLIRRVGRRGLSSASIEGFLASCAPIVGLIDADGQHDETALPEMIRLLQDDSLDLVVASRYADDGSADSMSGFRRFASQFATRLGSAVAHENITDPMSGFFVLRQTFLDSVVRDLSGKGYKILLDIVTSARSPLRYAEVAYTFRERQSGESKLDVNVVADYLLMLLEKTVGRFIPPRFVLFVASGSTGAIVHLLLLGLLFNVAGTSFLAAQLVASLIAMINNFIVNNHLTYHDQKQRGWRAFRALGTFMAICSVGGLINLMIATDMFDAGLAWWLAGLIGAGIGAVWNYTISATLTWPSKRRRSR